MIGELSGDTADFLNEIPWFDGIIYIILLMGLYVFYKWVNKKFKQRKVMRLFDFGIILAVVMLPWLVYSIWITP